ncbi:MAG: Lrp/AsnC family transcriptional regulator [Dehalococcoidia bacterium]|nr:Lrp/AsnC family transcriptional regulator [Dehalococcoidia bacterium]
MSANAYVLLNIEPVRTQEVIKRLLAIKGALVREVIGPYDVILELEGGTVEDITSVVRQKIRTIAGITGTVTCMWVTEQAGHTAGG